MSSAVALRVVAPVIFWPLQRDRYDPVGTNIGLFEAKDKRPDRGKIMSDFYRLIGSAQPLNSINNCNFWRHPR
ncbi:hypothetical protein D7I41_08495 [Ochrobactrum sp. MH181795]|nr:hypothetical protein DNK03_13830 [Brucella anthropi]RNL45424.1 hypothetical protein D7I41_08495 [Ochrobactrum sp. MH181795]